MQKNIFVVILTFSVLATAPAVANPLNLFIQQCLRYEPSLADLDFNQPVAKQAVQFEQLTLGFNNINDRLNYYRDLAVVSQRESILMCQLHLADELQAMLKDDKLDKLIHNLTSKPPYSSLAKKLNEIKLRQLDITSKSKLHNAQATIRRNLASNQVEMLFNDEQCSLQDQSQQAEHIKFDLSLAKYLILQPNEQCRKSAWLAYQSRAKIKNTASLNIIKTQHQTNVNNAVNSQLLDYQSLMDYLVQQTINIDVAPWNIGQHLAALPHSSYSGLTSAQEIQDVVFKQLKLLGIRIEPLSLVTNTALNDHQVNSIQAFQAEPHDRNTKPKQHTENNVYRVWHQQRLLGELFISPAAKTTTHIIRYPVIGHQFGQASISYPQRISNRRQANKLIDAIAEAIAGLARGNKFYLHNKLGVSSDNHLLGQLWLAEYIKQTYDQNMSPREQAAAEYRQQLRVFRSKVILDYYLNEQVQPQQLSLAFQQSFNHQWQDAEDAAFSFNGIANEGINYYLPLWHQSLVSMIFEASKPSVTERQVFDIFVVNEDNLTLSEQMHIILTLPNDPSSIIRRAFNVGH